MQKYGYSLIFVVSYFQAMKKWITLVLVSIAVSLHAQDIINVSADYILVDTNNNFMLVQQKGDTIREIQIGYFKDEINIGIDTIYKKKISLSNFKKEKLDSGDIFFPVNTLYENATENFVSQLSNYQFEISVGDDGYNNKFCIIKNKKLLVRSYSNNELKVIDSAAFSIVLINKKYNIFATAYILTGYNFYLFQTAKNKFSAYTEYKEDTLAIHKREPKDSINKEVTNCFFKQSCHCDVDFYDVVLKNGKYGLENFIGNSIFPCIYDTILFTSNCILPLKNGKGTLYTYNTTKIAKNVRYIYDICIMQGADPRKNECVFPFLQNNTWHYLTSDLKVSDTFPATAIRNYGFCGNVYNFDYTITKSDTGFLILEKVDGRLADGILNEIPYYLPAEYKSLSFLNGENTFGYSANGFLTNPFNLHHSPDNIFIYEDKNGKYGLIKSDDISSSLTGNYKLEKYREYEYDTSLSEKKVFDTRRISATVLLSNLDSVAVSHYGDYPLPLKIYKNGLCNYYPISAVPKYKSIDGFNGYFARFRLPNGKEGWLSKNNVEYLDE